MRKEREGSEHRTLFSSDQDAIDAVGNSNMSSTPSLTFPNIACETVPQWLMLLGTSDLSRHKPLQMVAFHASLCAWSFPLNPACPGQCIHSGNLCEWLSNIDTDHCQLLIPTAFHFL